LPLSTSAEAPNPVQFLFVDAVRFWSMLAVVALHATQWQIGVTEDARVTNALSCLFKYGTIDFFLISGFLLGDRMSSSDPIRYLSRRLRTLFTPWAFWFGVYMLYLLAADAAHHRVADTSVSSWLHVIEADLLQAAFGTSFWFVPNLALGMCLLVLFRRYLHSIWLGVGLFTINLVYVADIYREWFLPRHTSALFAFVSFLWLGSYTAKNLSRFTAIVNRIPMAVAVALVALAYAGSLAEIGILASRHSFDPFNTLRPSNQVFSICTALLIFKLKSASWPSFINVRKQTFSIYLLHTFFLRIGALILKNGLRPHLSTDLGPVMILALHALLFVFAYGGSLLLGRLIANSARWRWTIGLKPHESDHSYDKRACRISAKHKFLPVI
jgi:hypothetical protein